jgi:hypothetical protein
MHGYFLSLCDEIMIYVSFLSTTIAQFFFIMEVLAIGFSMKFGSTSMLDVYTCNNMMMMMATCALVPGAIRLKSWQWLALAVNVLGNGTTS